MEGTKTSRCMLCLQSPGFRRGLCRACYRKLREADIPLPPAAKGGQRTFVQWLRRWPEDVRARLRDVLAALAQEEQR